MVPEGQRHGLNESGRWKDCFFCRWDAVIFSFSYFPGCVWIASWREDGV